MYIASKIDSTLCKQIETTSLRHRVTSDSCMSVPYVQNEFFCSWSRYCCDVCVGGLVGSRRIGWGGNGRKLIAQRLVFAVAHNNIRFAVAASQIWNQHPHARNGENDAEHYQSECGQLFSAVQRMRPQLNKCQSWQNVGQGDSSQDALEFQIFD